MPFDVAHRDVEDPVGLAGVEDRDDVRVVEAGCELGLAQEPLAESSVVGELGREQLERRASLEADLLGQVDDAHPAPADQPLDPVARKGAADPLVLPGLAAHDLTIRLCFR